MTDQSTSHNSQAQPQSPEPVLCEADGEILDALCACDFDCSQFDGEGRIRAERLVQLLGLVDRYPTEPAEGHRLVADTMLRIDQFERGRREPVVAAIDGGGEAFRPFPGRFNWRTSLAAAAAILILMSVTVPMLANMRRTAMQQACLGALGNVALGLTNYANSYEDSLPVHTASAPDGNWLSSRVNSSNLFYLARAGFVTFDDLTCPGNRYAESADHLARLDNWPSSRATSFSYQNVLTGQRPRWNAAPQMVIMADKSPLVEAAHDGRTISVDALSPSHRHGQNALLSDGSAIWLESAQFQGDNIWIPQTCQSKSLLFVGDEMPGAAYDSMLIH